MLRIAKIVSTAVFFIFATATFSYSANGWQGPMTVTCVVAHKDCYVIDTDASISDCGISGRFTVKIDAMMADDIYKTAIVALLTGRYVHIYVDASQGCLISGMVSTRIMLH
ncbi:hypothetical protein [Methanopyrus sp.]